MYSSLLLTSRTASSASLGSSIVTKAYPLLRPVPPGSSEWRTGGRSRDRDRERGSRSRVFVCVGVCKCG